MTIDEAVDVGGPDRWRPVTPDTALVIMSPLIAAPGCERFAVTRVGQRESADRFVVGLWRAGWRRVCSPADGFGAVLQRALDLCLKLTVRPRGDARRVPVAQQLEGVGLTQGKPANQFAGELKLRRDSAVDARLRTSMSATTTTT
jgi:hypothetical protein